MNPVDWELLSGTERALVRLLAGEGGSSSAGYRGLARAVGRSETWVTIALGRLRERGWISIVRASRRRPARISFTDEGRRLVPVQPGAPVLAAVAGFAGDANARTVARIAARIGRGGEASPEEYARHYLASCSSEEAARLEALTDDWGAIPSETTPTGDDRLDEGLRVLFGRKAQRAMRRGEVLEEARRVEANRLRDSWRDA